jgi:uncharacterized membrane protein
MTVLVLGLLIFLGVHSIRIVADVWRTAMIARIGTWTWKGLYVAVSLVGFALLVWGYGQARAQPVDLWNPPQWANQLNVYLMLLSFVLVVAAYVPGNHIKAAMGHPMLLGTKVWAIGHLLSNGRLEDVVLFGAFLAWAVLNFSASRKRDRAARTEFRPGTVMGTTIVVIVGAVFWVVFARYLHPWLIGVAVI